VRDYDPLFGRFIARDPLGAAAGDPDVYGYCLDDPVNMVDPTGMFSLPSWSDIKQWFDVGSKAKEFAKAASDAWGVGAKAYESIPEIANTGNMTLYDQVYGNLTKSFPSALSNAVEKGAEFGYSFKK
jgi:uncharacterized protein RhaS with RHS repeats